MKFIKVHYLINGLEIRLNASYIVTYGTGDREGHSTMYLTGLNSTEKICVKETVEELDKMLGVEC